MRGVSEATHRSRITQDHPATERVNQPGREEAVVRAGEHPIEHERPEQWGWHGETGRAGRIGAWFTVLVLLSYLVGNHEGRVEDIWIVGIAGTLVAILLWDIRRRKNAWRSR
jgi:Protein of unknown function (DUF2631)